MGKVCALFAVLVLAAGCSTSPGEEAVARSEDPIIGGVAASSASMNAVGSLVTIMRYPDPSAPNGERIYTGSPFCSGTLIGKTAVLTAKHCVESVGSNEYGFAIGTDARTPVRIVPVVEHEVETTVKGGFLSKGSDVAVLHLETAVNDVEPLAWGTFDATDVGRRFVAMGYGTQNVNGTFGTRRAGSLTLKGTEGKVFELAFGSFDAFKEAIPRLSDISYQVGDVATADGERRARELYDGRVLLAGYEAFLGNAKDDAQTCHGDSGGPLIRRVNGKNTTFGVVSWGHHSTFGYAFCDFGAVFGAFGPSTQTFLTKALAWQDVCADTTVKGGCDRDVAVRCTAKAEGTRRVVRADCAELGLTCGKGPDGQAACVDPK